MYSVIIIAVILFATWAAWQLWSFLAPLPNVDDQNSSFIRSQIKYQSGFLLIALLVIAFAYNLSGQVLGIGVVGASLHLGVPAIDGTSWLVVGFIMTVLFAVVTYLMVASSFSKLVDRTAFLKKFGFWIVLFAALNALSEELIYRGALIFVLEGSWPAWQIALLSAILFSVAHIRGQVNGVFVLLGSAVVGWCLAHAVLQTQGLFWAWCVHFVQDIFIFAAFIAQGVDEEPRHGPVC